MKLQSIRLSGSDKITLISNLSTMLAAGIPIMEAVRSIKQESKGNQRKVLETLESDLAAGNHVHMSFAKFPKVFNKVTVNLIKASEEAGNLETTLRDIKKNIQDEMEFSDKVKSSLMYPVFVMIVFVGVFLGILVFVVPRISTVFTRLRVELPLPTRIMIAVSDLIVGNNVYAHVPDINDFSRGLKAVLKPDGVITLEFPHLMRLIEQAQFDTVYHEHFSYLSLQSVSRIFEKTGLRVWDVEELSTHGGSLRVYGCHAESSRPASAEVQRVLDSEVRHGLRDLATYLGFQPRADRVKNDLLAFLIEQKRAGKSVAAYSAAAKGNTLLNYAGVKPDLLPYVCDAAPSKQGKYLPGSHIPIVPPAALAERKPDVVLILSWNLKTEITRQLAYVKTWSGKFVTAVPSLEIE